MSPLTAIADWAVKRSPWWLQMQTDLENERINNKICQAMLEAARAQAVLKAKAEIVDDLRTALEAHNA